MALQAPSLPNKTRPAKGKGSNILFVKAGLKMGKNVGYAQPIANDESDDNHLSG